MNAFWLSASLLICGCGSAYEPEQPIQPPYWKKSPSLPNRPANFCSKAVAAFQGRVQEIKCQDRIAGANGIRGDLGNTELVVLQGANEEWFAMAFQNSGNEASQTRIHSEELASIVSRLEDAFRN